MESVSSSCSRRSSAGCP